MRYEPGEIRVVVYDADGNPAGEQTVKTAGAPARLHLKVWTQHSTLNTKHSTLNTHRLLADGDDLAFVTVSLTDAEGNLIPDASDQLTFDVSGAGTFEAVCNGDATSLESFKAPTMRLFSGQLVVIVRSTKTPGTITLRVTDPQRQLSHAITLRSERLQ